MSNPSCEILKKSDGSGYSMSIDGQYIGDYPTVVAAAVDFCKRKEEENHDESGSAGQSA